MARSGCDRYDRSTWTKPVIRLPGYGQEPFKRAVNTTALYEAFDALVGKGRWVPRDGLGTFPVRFPSDSDPGDTGWHAEASFQGADGSWRTNVNSKGRALLMLFLFSDIGINDAPTRILTGSHLDVPQILDPFGEEGLDFITLSRKFPKTTLDRPCDVGDGRGRDGLFMSSVSNSFGASSSWLRTALYCTAAIAWRDYPSPRST